MEVTYIQDDEEDLEIEINDSILPNVLATRLARNKIDSYFYNPHPLLPGYRIHLESKNGKKDIKKAISDVEKDIDEMSDLFSKGLK
jgi:DNA-directed RNA polymerase subunit L